MNSSDKGFVATIAIIMVFLTIVILSITYDKKVQADTLKESYLACLQTQKATTVDLNCGDTKEIK